MRLDAIGSQLDELANAEDEREDGCRIADPLQDCGELDGAHGVLRFSHNIAQNQKAYSANSLVEEIVDEHHVDGRLSQSGVQDEAAVVRNGHPGGAFASEVVQEQDYRALPSFEIIEINPQVVVVRSISVVDALFGNDKVGPRCGGRGIHNFHFPATLDGHAPKAGHVTALCIVDEFTVWGRLRGETALMSELNRGATLRWNLPDFPGAAAIRTIVDRISVGRPIGDAIF